MNADPAAQLRLLDLQSCDTAIAQLDHRRRTLPELAALAAAQSRLDEIDQEIVELQTRLTDIVGEQTRIEGDVDAVRARAARDEQRLTSGGLPAKDLESLQHEITSLARRQSTLEDEVLEVMERREELEAQQAERTSVRAEVEVEHDDLTVQRDSHFAEIDAARKLRAAGAGRDRRRDPRRPPGALREGAGQQWRNRRGDAASAPVRGLSDGVGQQRTVLVPHGRIGHGDAL